MVLFHSYLNKGKLTLRCFGVFLRHFFFYHLTLFEKPETRSPARGNQGPPSVEFIFSETANVLRSIWKHVHSKTIIPGGYIIFSRAKKAAELSAYDTCIGMHSAINQATPSCFDLKRTTSNKPLRLRKYPPKYPCLSS